MHTWVSAGSSWGRGSSGRGRSLSTPPWRQLEHLQVPLLMSPARGMQGKTEGAIDSQTHNAGEA